jgi:hypothetical protein
MVTPQYHNSEVSPHSALFCALSNLYLLLMKMFIPPIVDRSNKLRRVEEEDRENIRGKCELGHLGLDRKRKLCWAMEIDCKGGNWIELAQDMMQWLPFMITILKLCSTTGRNVFIS